MKKKVKIGLIQMRAQDSALANCAQAERMVRLAAKKGAQIICLQELFLSSYFPQKKDKKFLKLAESIPGERTEIFSELAKQLKIVIILPIFEVSDSHFYNSAVVIDATGELLGHYRKMHLPDDPYFYEQFYFSKGDLGFKTFKTQYANIGVLICWDQWFPEAARALAQLDAQILFYPTAIGWIQGESKAKREEERSAWEIIQRSHAIANGVFVASVNRIGREEKLTFWGGSFVAGPFGEVLKYASETKEEMIVAECDFSKIREIRKIWPFLDSRRLDAYGQTI